MARQLLRRGHEVEVYSLRIGPFAATFPCPVVQSPTGKYALGLVNHNTCVSPALDACDCVVMTCHGVYPVLEQPVPGPDAFVSVCEAVRDHLRCFGYEATVIRNGIEMEEYSGDTRIAPSLTRVLSLCQGEEASYQVACACARQGLEYRREGLDRNRLSSVRAAMEWADCVVGLGRTALEAMAMGRAVLVCDSRSYMSPMMDGMVVPENLGTIRYFNFNGRGLHRRPSVAGIEAELSTYSDEMGLLNLQIIKEDFAIEGTCEQYLALYDRLCKKGV